MQGMRVAMTNVAVDGVAPAKFDREVKHRGEQYFKQKRVQMQPSVDGTLSAAVRGKGDNYDVILDWRTNPQQPKSYCSCPYFAGTHQCKHVWAVLLAAEKAGHLKGVTSSPTKSKLPTGNNPTNDAEYNVSLERISNVREQLKGRTSKELLKHLREKLLTPQQEEAQKKEAARLRREAEMQREELARRSAWKKQMAVAQHFDHQFAQLAPTEAAAAQDRRVAYVLEKDSAASHGCVVIKLLYAERKKDGQWGKMRALFLESNLLHAWEGHADYPLLRQLYTHDSSQQYTPARYSYYSLPTDRTDTVWLDDETAIDLLPTLARTGRFGWFSGDIRNFEWEQLKPLAWDEGGLWHLKLTINRRPKEDWWQVRGALCRAAEERPLADVVTVLANEAYCFVALAGELVQLTQPSDAGWIRTLAEQGVLEVPDEHRQEFVREWWKLTTPPRLEAPAEFALTQIQVPPRPMVRLFRPAWDKEKRGLELYGQILFQYGDVSLPASQPGSGVVTADGQQVVLRNRGLEIQHLGELVQTGLRLQPQRDASFYRHAAETKHDFVFPAKQLTKLVGQLTAAGWQVEAEGNVIRSAGSFSFSVTSGVDWFDLDGVFDFGGAQAQLPALLAALRKGESFVTLSDGTQGMLPAAWLQKFGFLADLGENETGKVRFKSSQGLLLDALLASQPNVQWDERFGAWRQKLKAFAGVKPAEAPDQFQGKLRKYQQEGLGWLKFLREFNFGGCLADDMGLGKTVQVLALLQARRLELKGAKKKRRPNLIVVPRSLIFNWKQEAARFTPDLTVLDFAGVGRKSMQDQLATSDIVLTTYGTLLKDVAEFKDFEFDYVILDEAQAIKNSAAQCTKACRLLQAEHRLALTGTPIENHLGELWSIFEFLNPGMLGNSAAFQRFARGGAEGEAEGREMLSRAIAPFVLRRTKKQVLKDLPEKTEQTLYCDLGTKERKKYNELKDFYRQSLTSKIATTGLEKSKIHVLEALLRLRQASCHLGLLDPKLQKESSAKLDALLEQLDELLAEGHKALVFSQFTSLLAIVKKHLDKQKIVYEYLDGQTRDRQTPVERFQTDDKCQLFLISLKAGGKGLNLTAADYVFILDPWWNPAVEAQAIDRAHRLGQDKPVFAYRLIARDTVEEKILELQDGKRNLAESIISGDSSVLKGLTAEDLQLLLS